MRIQNEKYCCLEHEGEVKKTVVNNKFVGMNPLEPATTHNSPPVGGVEN